MVLTAEVAVQVREGLAERPGACPAGQRLPPGAGLSERAHLGRNAAPGDRVHRLPGGRGQRALHPGRHPQVVLWGRGAGDESRLQVRLRHRALRHTEFRQVQLLRHPVQGLVQRQHHQHGQQGRVRLPPRQLDHRAGGAGLHEAVRRGDGKDLPVQAGGHLPPRIRTPRRHVQTAVRVLRHHQRGRVPEGPDRQPPVLAHHRDEEDGPEQVRRDH